MSEAILPEIAENLAAIPVIDCHEHFPEESTRIRKNLDFGHLFTGYAGSDLAVAGMPQADVQRLTNSQADIDEKWRLIEPYYQRTRNTAYIRALEIAFRDLYGIESLTQKTYRQLTEQIRKHNKPGLYRWVLKEKCNIELCLNNSLDEWPFRERSDPDFFLQDLSIVKLLQWPPPVEELQQATGTTIKKFDDYRDAIDACFAKYAGIADAVKQQAAYSRPLRFEDVPEDRARRIFDSMTDPEAVCPADCKALQDWALHHCVQLCIEHDLPMKIHTGYLAGNDYMDLDQIKPADLNNLFIKYPQARFDLFHIGYPYQEEVLALAKHFANVYVDMCWVWIIDPLAARRFFQQAVVSVPGHKIFGFGGDYGQIEPAYGHLQIARQQMGIALTRLVEDGWLSVKEALGVARRVLHDNPTECFRIEPKRRALRETMAEAG